MAPGPSGSGKVGEARALLDSAQAALDANGRADEALRFVDKALTIFREVADNRGVADGLCIKVAAVQVASETLRAEFKRSDATQLLEDGTKEASAELRRFQESDDKYCEACTLYALAELSPNRAERESTQRPLEEALSQLTRSTTIFKDLGEPRREALSSLACSVVYGQLSRWHDASDSAAAALKTFQAKGDKINMAKAYQCLGRYRILAENSNPTCKAAINDAFLHLQRALDLFRDLGDKTAEAFNLYITASTSMAIGRTKNALRHARQAMDVFKGIEADRGGKFQSRSLVIELLAQLYDWRGAIRLATEAVDKIRQGKHDVRMLVLALDRTVILHLQAHGEQRGDMDHAKSLAEEARQLCQDLGDKKWEANAAFNVAQILVRQDRKDEAMSTVSDAVRMDEECGVGVDRAVKMQFLIDLYIKAEKFDKALEVVTEMREIHKNCGNPTDEAYALLTKASCHASNVDYKSALQAAQDAQQLFQQENDRAGEADALDLMHRLHDVCGQPDAAETAVQHAKQLHRDLPAQAEVARQAAMFYATRERFDDALKAAYEAEAFAKSSDDPKVEVEMKMLVVQAELGKLFSHSSSADAASQNLQNRLLRTAREAAVLARAHGCDYMSGGCVYSLAQALLVNGRGEASLRASNEAEDLWNRVGNSGGVAYATLLGAEAMAYLDRYNDAVDRAELALQTFKQLGLQDGVSQANKTLDLIRSSNGRRNATPNTNEEIAEVPSIEDAHVSMAPKAKAMELEVAQKLVMDAALSAIGTSEDDLNFDSPVMDMGLDSLSAIAFREHIVSASGLNVSSSLVFDYPSLMSMADHLVELSTDVPTKR